MYSINNAFFLLLFPTHPFVRSLYPAQGCFTYQATLSHNNVFRGLT